MKTEHRLLLWLSNKQRCQPGAELADLLNSHVNWKEVVENAKTHRVSPLCHRYVEQLDESVRCLVQFGARLAFAQQYLASLERTAVLYSELKPLAAAFDSASLNVVLMKGLALGKLVYEDIALRPFGDLDLVVLPCDYERAKQVLIEMGYRQTVRDFHTGREVDVPIGLDRYECRFNKHGPPFRRVANIDDRALKAMVSEWSVRCAELQPFLDRLQNMSSRHLGQTGLTVAVELHVSFLELHGRFVASGYSEEDDAAVHQRAGLVEFDPNFSMRVPSAEDLVILTCEHHARLAVRWSSVVRLYMVCDAREAAMQFQAPESLRNLMIVARQMRLERSVSSMFAQAKQLDVEGALESAIPHISPHETDFLEVFHENEEGPQCRWETPYVSRLFKPGPWGPEAFRIWRRYRSRTGNIRKVVCPKVGRPLDMDGRLSDPLWSSAGSFDIDARKTLEGEHVLRVKPGDTGKPIGVNGHVCWNEEFLFAAVVVKDEVVICGDPAAVGVFYNQDQVRLHFWFDDTVKIYAVLLRPDLTSGACLCVEHGADGYDCVRTAASKGNDGYAVEVALAFSELGICPKHGMSIGFDVQIDDCDDAEMGVGKTLSWAGAGAEPQVTVPYGELCFVDSTL